MGNYADKLNMHLLEPPPAETSERKIAEDAPAAIAYLDRHNVDDLYEALGLSNYVKDNQNGVK